MAIARQLAQLDLRDAQASAESDRLMIYALVEQMPGGFDVSWRNAIRSKDATSSSFDSCASLHVSILMCERTPAPRGCERLCSELHPGLAADDAPTFRGGLRSGASLNTLSTFFLSKTLRLTYLQNLGNFDKKRASNKTSLRCSRPSRLPEMAHYLKRGCQCCWVTQRCQGPVRHVRGQCSPWIWFESGNK